jgi:hypothetical protein
MALLVFKEEGGIVILCIAVYIVLDRRISIARTNSVAATTLNDKISLSPFEGCGAKSNHGKLLLLTKDLRNFRRFLTSTITLVFQFLRD